jgi:S-adenosyl-L-methionine hydrolase (adenosine-forming)
MSVITLLTDFGLKDPYVGIMKGVILSINPKVRIVDITHEVEPQDTREAAFVIKEYYRFFEKGTVHLAIVDPMVGSARKPIAIVKDDHYFVGPDNGIFSFIIDGKTEVYEIENQGFIRPEISGTFHGRDIFAPAAAHLSMGVSPSDFGRRVENLIVLPDLFPKIDGDTIVGEIVRFDRYGNGITNISGANFQDLVRGHPFRINIGDLSFDKLSKSYYESELTCLIGSSGCLEFGVFRGNFKDGKGFVKGGGVKVRRL